MNIQHRRDTRVFDERSDAGANAEGRTHVCAVEANAAAILHPVSDDLSVARRQR